MISDIIHGTRLCRLFRYPYSGEAIAEMISSSSKRGGYGEKFRLDDIESAKRGKLEYLLNIWLLPENIRTMN